MSRHDLHGKMSNGQGMAGHSPFYIRGQMVHFHGRETKEIRTTREGLNELLKCRQERFDPCCIHIVSLVISHHR